MRYARLWASRMSSAPVSAFTQRNGEQAVAALDIHPVEKQHGKWIVKFSADPNRWISVTAPVRAVWRLNQAFLIKYVAMTR